jgi:hypothetical protein
MANIIQAIRSLVPNPLFTMVDNDYESINWLDSRPQPTEAEANAEIQRLNQQAPIDACEAKAKELIANCDWSVLPDVNLTNKAEFEAYRATLRNYILNPVANPDFPTEPQPVWG